MQKFNARFLAASRVYEYYLPISLLGETGGRRACISADTSSLNLRSHHLQLCDSSRSR